MKFEYTQLERDTKAPGISLHDITGDIRAAVASAGITDGYVNVLSRHTTTAVTINEAEPRLMDDVRIFLKKLAPPNDFYLHNDLHVREAPKDWPGGDDAWREQEPENCHSHLLSMLIGNSETIPVVDGRLVLGTWQSVMLVELDGPRRRTVGVHVAGVVSSEPKEPSASRERNAAEPASSAPVSAPSRKEKIPFEDAMDALCDEDPSADECKMFD